MADSMKIGLTKEEIKAFVEERKAEEAKAKKAEVSKPVKSEK